MIPVLFKLRPLLGRALQAAGTSRAPKGVGPWQHGFYPMPVTAPLTIVGVTRDNTGAALGNCEVELYRRSQDNTSMAYVDRTVSDGSGNFSFVVGPGMLYQFVAYQAGSPDKAGVSLRTLVGA